MTAPAKTYQRRIEDAVVTLLSADADMTYVFTDTTDPTRPQYAAKILRAYDFVDANKITRLSLLVECRDLTNAMLGNTGRCNLWSVMLRLSVKNNIADDKADENADRLQGACERWLNALSTTTLNTALTGQGITIHGFSAAQDTDEMDQSEGALRRTSVVTVHFEAT